MRAVRVLSLAATLAVLAGCASEPMVAYPTQSGRTYGAYGGSGYRQQDPLRKGASDANAVESIVSSAARIGRLLGGSSF